VHPLFLRPGTLNEALEVLAQTRGTILSGGTDLFPATTASQLPGTIIDISRVSELCGIQLSEDTIRIGARATWAEVASASLPPGFDGLRAAAREIGGIQIQNQGTVGGNICNASPAADGVAALMALDAEVTLASHAASRTIPLADFIHGNRTTARQPHEILTSVQIPRHWDNAASSFLKLGARRYLVISIVMVAANLLVSRGTVSKAAIFVGSCSPKALRLDELERALVGASISRKLFNLVQPEHFSALSPIDDVRATAAYRHEAAQTLVRRAIEECARKAR
jgi:CO/xanthine dehydrogenase FAD-binding subunit